jgi:hypothetical protein
MRENRIWRNKMAKIVPAAIGQSAGLLQRKSEAEGYVTKIPFSSMTDA